MKWLTVQDVNLHHEFIVFLMLLRPLHLIRIYIDINIHMQMCVCAFSSSTYLAYAAYTAYTIALVTVAIVVIVMQLLHLLHLLTRDRICPITSLDKNEKPKVHFA